MYKPTPTAVAALTLGATLTVPSTPRVATVIFAGAGLLDQLAGAHPDLVDWTLYGVAALILAGLSLVTHTSQTPTARGQ